MNFCITIFLKFSILTHGNYQAIIRPRSCVKFKVTTNDFQAVCSPKEERKCKNIIEIKPQIRLNVRSFLRTDALAVPQFYISPETGIKHILYFVAA